MAPTLVNFHSVTKKSRDATPMHVQNLLGLSQQIKINFKTDPLGTTYPTQVTWFPQLKKNKTNQQTKQQCQNSHFASPAFPGPTIRTLTKL